MAKRSAGSARVVRSSTSTTKWLQNAAKSIGLSTRKAFGEYAPNITDVATTGTRTARSVMQTIRKNGNVDRITSQLNQNKYVRFMQTAYKNAISDIRTGNLNNEERFQSTLFGDADNISEALDGFSFGDDGAESSTVNFINANDNGAILALANNMEKQSTANVKMQKASMDAFIAINAASMQQRGELGSEIISQLTNVNNNLAALVEYNNNNMNQFINSAMAWMEKTGPHMSGEDEDNGPRKVRGHDVINGGRGGINLTEYKNYVKQQFKGVAKNSSLGMVASMLDDDALNMLASNPMGFATDALVRAVMPKMLKTSLEALDKTFETMVPTLLTELGSWSEDGDYMKRMIGQIFGINLKRTGNFQAKVNYGAIPFDGETKHAITEIITKELADQTGYLKIIASKMTKTDAGKLEARVRNDREYWDRESNSFIRGKGGIDNVITTKLTEAIRDAMNGTDFGRGMSDLVKSQKNEKAQKSMQDAVDRLFAAIENSNNKLDSVGLVNLALSLSSGGNTAAFKSIADHIKKMDGNSVYSSNIGRINANRSLEDLIKEMEDNPSQYHLFNSSYNGNEKEIRELLSENLANKQRGSKRGKYSKFKGDYSTQNTGDASLFTGLNDAMKSIMAGDARGATSAIANELTKVIGNVGLKLKDSLFGEEGVFKDAGGKINDVVSDIKMRITGKGYTDSSGNQVSLNPGEESVFGNLKGIGSSIKHGIMEKVFGKKWNEESGAYEKTSEGLAGKFTEGFNKLSVALFGEEDPEAVKKRLAEHAKNLIPTAGTGAAVGGTVGILAGSSILGSLIGGPIGGAVLGMATGIVTKSETFQKWFFGEETEDENGNKTRSGGMLDKFISKDTRKMLSDNKNKLLGAGAIGAISGTITGGGILGTIVGGPIAGAAIGIAGTLLSQNKRVQNFLWGEKGGIKVGDKEFDKKGIFGQVATSIKVDLINPLKTTGEFILKDMKTTLVHEVAAPFVALGKHIGNKLSNAKDGLLTLFFGNDEKKGLLGVLAKPFRGLLDKVAGAAGKTISQLGEAIWGMTKRVITFPGKLITVALSKPVQAIKKGLATVRKMIFKGIAGTFSFIRKGLSTIIGKPLMALGKKISESAAGKAVRRGARAVRNKLGEVGGAIGRRIRNVEDRFDELMLGSGLAESSKKARAEHAANKAWLKKQRQQDKNAKIIAKLTDNQFSEYNEDAVAYLQERYGFSDEDKEDWLAKKGLKGDAGKVKTPTVKIEDNQVKILTEETKQTGLLESLLKLLNKEFGTGNADVDISPLEKNKKKSDDDADIANDLVNQMFGEDYGYGGEGKGRKRLHGGAGILSTVGGLLLNGLRSAGSSVLGGVKDAATSLFDKSKAASLGASQMRVVRSSDARAVDPDATNNRDYNSRMSQKDKNDAALDTARDRAHTAKELQAEAEAEREKKKENPMLTAIKDTRDAVKDYTKDWGGIFGKGGLITAGLVAGFLFLKNKFPGLFDALGTLATKIGSLADSLLNILGGTTKEAVEEMAWTNENNVRTGGNTATEEYNKQVQDIKNGDIFTNSNGEATSQSEARLGFAANMAKQWVNRSVKGGIGKTGKRIRGVMRGVEAVGKGIKGLGSTLWNGKAVSMGDEALDILAEANGIAPKTKGGIKNIAKAAGGAVQKKLSGTKVGKVAAAASDDVVKIAAKASDTTLAKGLKIAKDALSTFTKVVSDKLGKTVGKGCASIIEKFSSKLLKAMNADTLGGKVLTKLVTRLTGQTGAAAATAAVTLGLSEAVFATIGAINGVSGTAKLFEVDQSAVDGKMKVIAGAIGALTGTTVGSIIDIILSFVGPIIGTDPLHDLAVGIYKFWVEKTGDTEASAKLDEAKTAWKDEYLTYQHEQYEKAYAEYKKDGTIPEDMDLETFIAAVEDGQYEVEYKSFQDWNTENNAAISDKIMTGIGKGVKGLGKGLKTAGSAVVKGAKAAGGAIAKGAKALGDSKVGKAAKFYANYMTLPGLAVNAYKNKDKIAAGVKDGSAKIKKLVTAGAAKAKDTASSLYNAAKDKKDAFINNVKKGGLLAGIKGLTEKSEEGKRTKRNSNTKTEAWIDQDGCYYIKKSRGSFVTWIKYTPAGDEMEELDNDTVTTLLTSGLLVKTDVPGFAKSSINSSLRNIGNTLASNARSFWNKATSKISDLFKNLTGTTPSTSSNSSSTSTTTSTSTSSSGGGLLSGLANLFGFGGKGNGRRVYGGAGDNDRLNGSTYFSQSDPRWGNNSYNVGMDDATMDTTGCGPTAMAMAASDALGGGVNPMTMANMAKAFGDRDETGTNWDFINKASGAMGLRSQQALNPTADYISSQLDTGNPVILSGASGNGSVPYTPAGHYVVAVGKDRNGNIIVNDPRGRSYSGSYNLNAVANKTGSAWTIGGNGRRIRRGGGREVEGDRVGKNDVVGNATTKKDSLTDYQKWISIIRSVKKALADKQLGYSQSRFTDVSIGGKTISVRTDCSGFTGACLKFYGVIPDNTNMTSYAFTDSGNGTMTASGFTPRAWTSWEDLKEGDIIAKNGHVEIFANLDGGHNVYNCGSNDSCNNPNPTRSGNSAYTTVWSPGPAGSGCITNFDIVATDANGTVGSSSGDASVGGNASSTDSGDNIFSKLISYVGGAISKFAGNVIAGKMSDDYSVNAILGNSGSSSDSSSFGSSNSGAASDGNPTAPVTGSDDKEKIWNFYRNNLGLSAKAAAGMMGAAEEESHNNPGAYEGDYLSGAPGKQIIDDPQGRHNWQASIFEKYKKNGVSYSDTWYREYWDGNGKTHGNYFPGIGLVGYTGERGRKLYEWAKSKGKNWYDTDAQLDWLKNGPGEFDDRRSTYGLADKLEAASGPRQAADVALDYYINSSEVHGKSWAKASARESDAEQYYNKYKDLVNVDVKADPSKGITQKDVIQEKKQRAHDGGNGAGLSKQRRAGRRVSRTGRGAGGFGNACVNHVKRIHGGFGITGVDNYQASKYMDSAVTSGNSSTEDLMLNIIQILTYIASDMSSSNQKLDMLKNIGNNVVSVDNRKTIVGTNGKAVQRTNTKSDASEAKIMQKIAQGGY